MIAKSDTQRRSGIGAKFYQDYAIHQIFEKITKFLNENHPKNKITLTAFIGSGNAIQRGGGNPGQYSLVPLKIAKYAKEKIHQNIKANPVSHTCQGHQRYLHYSPGTIAQNTLESHYSEAIYANARLKDLLNNNPVIKENNTIELDLITRIRITKKASDLAIKTYNKYIGEENNQKEKPFDQLISQMPWIFSKQGNNSSRTSIKNQKDIETKITAEKLKGKNPKILQQRAIGVEKLSSISGSNLVSIFGAKELLSTIMNESTKRHRHPNNFYKTDKTSRDLSHGLAISLFNAHLNIIEEIITKNHDTLNFYKKYCHQTTQLLHQFITGHLPKKPINLKYILKNFWPNEAKELEQRYHLAKKSHHQIATLTKHLNQNPKKNHNLKAKKPNAQPLHYRRHRHRHTG